MALDQIPLPSGDLQSLVRSVEQLIRAIEGDPDGSGGPGLRERVDLLEKQMRRYQRIETLLYGVILGLSLVGLTSAGTLVTVLTRFPVGP